MLQSAALLLLAHTAAALALTGIIWWVQIVHYPLFLKVPEAGFAAYEREHVKRTGWLVAPLMLFELTTGIVLMTAVRVDEWEFGLSLFLLAGIWVSTFLLQVPLHRRLSEEFERKATLRLIRTNWLRTLGWTGRSILLLVLLSRLFLEIPSS